jgi:hypothetical protein
MNPDMIDGVQDVRNQWSGNNVKQAVRAEAIVKRLDPGRIVYHHSSGNLGSMHTANFYANFAPIQEMSDWFEHWATKGVKPVFLCEYGVPIFWDWMMYRGWYKGTRTFGNAQVPWEFCLAEWDAQFFGAEAYKLTELEKECLRWEAKRFRAGQVWHRWDYPRNAIESPNFEQRNEVMAMYLTDNLRAFRTWGISAFCPWDHGNYWKLRDGVSRARKELKVDWNNLQRPGFSPDYIDGQMEWINTSFERSDWIPTTAGKALIRNNQPLLAYIGGKPVAFTGKDHDFHPGETVEKQLIIINNSRRKVSCDCNWSLALPKSLSGHKEITVETGDQSRVPMSFNLPAALPPGRYLISASVKFKNGGTQDDTFAIDILPRRPDGSRPSPVAATSVPRTALFDPRGDTAKLLGVSNVRYTPVDATADLSPYDTLIIGKEALTTNSPAPDITRVRDGLKVVLFEQTPEVLERRFGFRVAQYGLRRMFKRVPDHPILDGIADEHLADWRGEATLQPPRLPYQIGQRHAPEVLWCDIPVTRLWRAGNRGNVASVLIEKPACGDFLPILDGGFSLQFSPLLEYREGKGMILFCQLDVTGRTENDPAAEILAHNLVEYAASWKPAANRKVIYAGNPACKRHLDQSGFAPIEYTGGMLSKADVLVVAPGGGEKLSGYTNEITNFLRAGGNVLAIGLGQDEANAALPFRARTKNAEHISTFFEPFGKNSLLSGVSPADVHNRDPRNIPLITQGATEQLRGHLWRALRERARDPAFTAAHRRLSAWLGRADFTTPFDFFAQVLGPEGGRERLLERLGHEASDPIDELLARALQYQRSEAASLQGFLRWFDAGGGEIKRDLDANRRPEVRILTVHASKGLQAPIVYLPDTTRVPRDTERLLTDAMKGDQTLFAREDSVEQAWRIVQPVLGPVTRLYEYDPQTWGPREADKIAAGFGGWHNPIVTA